MGGGGGGIALDESEVGDCGVILIHEETEWKIPQLLYAEMLYY